MCFSERTTTAVIPAYNEEKQIGQVLSVLCRVRQLSQVIVVDDGSVDGTSQVVAAYQDEDKRIELVPLSPNRGKGGAMLAGARASKNDLIIFLDADLIGLRPEHVLALLEPVQKGCCSMTIGTFSQGRRQTDWSHRLTPFLSGQRCLAWSLFRDTPSMGVSRWGIELALSLYAWRNQHRVIRVALPGVTHTMRMEKMNVFKGYWSHLQMWRDVGWYLVQYLQHERRLASKQRRQKQPGYRQVLAQRLRSLFGPGPGSRMTRLYHGDMDEN